MSHNLTDILRICTCICLELNKISIAIAILDINITLEALGYFIVVVTHNFLVLSAVT